MATGPSTKRRKRKNVKKEGTGQDRGRGTAPMRWSPMAPSARVARSLVAARGGQTAMSHHVLSQATGARKRFPFLFQDMQRWRMRIGRLYRWPGFSCPKGATAKKKTNRAKGAHANSVRLTPSPFFCAFLVWSLFFLLSLRSWRRCLSRPFFSLPHRTDPPRLPQRSRKKKRPKPAAVRLDCCLAQRPHRQSARDPRAPRRQRTATRDKDDGKEGKKREKETGQE